jgi:hypothetical protein
MKHDAMRELVRTSTSESVQSITLSARSCAMTTRKNKIALEIRIILYILNAVYPDNGDYPWLQ